MSVVINLNKIDQSKLKDTNQRSKNRREIESNIMVIIFCISLPLGLLMGILGVHGIISKELSMTLMWVCIFSFIYSIIRGGE